MGGEQSPLRAAWVAERWSTAVGLLEESAAWLAEAEVQLSVHGMPDVPAAEIEALGATPYPVAPLVGPAPVRAAALALQVEAQWASSPPDWVHAVGAVPALALGATAHLFAGRRVLAHVGEPVDLSVFDAVGSGVATWVQTAMAWCASGVERWIVQGVGQREAWRALGVPEERLVVLPLPTGCAGPDGEGALGRGGRVRAALGLDRARFVLRTDLDPDQLAALPTMLPLLRRIARTHGASWMVVTPAYCMKELQVSWPEASVTARGIHKDADLVDAAEVYVDAVSGLLAPRRTVEACLWRLPVAGGSWAEGFPGAEEMGSHRVGDAALLDAVSDALDDIRGLSMRGAKARAWAQRSFGPTSCRRALVGLWMPRTAPAAAAPAADAAPQSGRRDLLSGVAAPGANDVDPAR